MYIIYLSTIYIPSVTQLDNVQLKANIMYAHYQNTTLQPVQKCNISIANKIIGLTKKNTHVQEKTRLIEI